MTSAAPVKKRPSESGVKRLTINSRRNMNFVPATQLTKYLTKSCISGSGIKLSQAPKTPTLLAYSDPGQNQSTMTLVVS